MYLQNQKAVSSGDYSFDARNDGKHTYCFSNEAWSASTKEVSFNVHGIVYVPESEAPSDPLEKEGTCHCSINLGHHLQRAFYLIQLLTLVYYITVKELTELLQQVKDEQSYIIVRERTHRNTAESTNARVKWWSIFQLGVLIGEGIFQVWWLKRFFEVCRSSIQRSECALIMFGVGKEGCLSADGHMALALYIRIWIDYFRNTMQSESRISEELYSLNLKTNLAG